MKSFFIVYFWALLVCCMPLAAQQTQIYIEPNVTFKQAQQHYEQGNYALTRQLVEQLLYPTQQQAPRFEYLTEARFYQAMCARKLQQPDAELLLLNFVNDFPVSAWSSAANYELGKIYFEDGDYKSAIAAFEDVDPASLSNAERLQYYFQAGYANFVSKKFDEAQELLGRVTNKYPNPYYEDANYYYGVAAYFKKDYRQALESFKKIEQNPKYSPSMPYYITLIYYTQKKTDDLLAYAVPKTQQSNVKNQKEINMIVGQSYFSQKKFKEAIPYLEYYVKNTDKVRKEDLYQLGMAQYQSNQIEAAIPNLAELNSLKDSLGQNAMYHLADCYLKTNDKSKANAAFEAAARLSHNKEIQEIAAFNHAKMSYDLGLNSTALNKLQAFLKDYPKSTFANEAKNLLSSIFETTQNYKEALALLENTPNKDTPLLRTYQRVAYYRAIELHNDRKYEDAIALLDKSLQNPLDPTFTALAHFWKGDMYYKTTDYNNAFNSMQNFIARSSTVPISDQVSHGTANYTMGYALFKQGQYRQALPYFESSVAQLGGKPELMNALTVTSQVYPDAILRAGDCYFMQKNYTKANEQYDDVLKYGLRGADYAAYQKGILAGLAGKPADKVDLLTQMTKKYPESLYLDDAWYQIALAHSSQENYEAAINAHKTVIGKYPQSSYFRKSLLNLGLLSYNTNNYEQSLKYYQQLLRDYPKSSEAQDALVGIKDVYIAKGDADGYVTLIKQYPDVNFTVSAQDSLSYQIAENYYSQGDCNKAVSSFDKYLKSYPKGAFALYAHFYRGQCLYSRPDYKAADDDYTYVIEQPNNLFTDQALDKATQIALLHEKNYEKAYTYSKRLYENAARKDLRLDALRNSMRAAYYLKKENDLDARIDLLLKENDKTADDEIEAYFYRGMLAYNKNNFTKAKQSLQLVISRTTNEKGAQARYALADIAYQQKEYDNAKALCFKVINETASQEYWVVKSFILLSDVYVAKNDLFQAKATLNSIIDNYEPEDELKKEAREKLNKITKGESATSKIKTTDKKSDTYLEMEGK